MYMVFSDPFLVRLTLLYMRLPLVVTVTEKERLVRGFWVLAGGGLQAPGLGLCP